MVYIAYFTELILQICDYAQKRRIDLCIWRENFDENFHCHFCSRRKAAKFCHPEVNLVCCFAAHCLEATAHLSATISNHVHLIPMSIGVRFSIKPCVCFQWVSWERLLWRESFRINRPLIPPFSWATTLHILHFEYCLHIEVKSQGAFVHQTQFFKANFWHTR